MSRLPQAIGGGRVPKIILSGLVAGCTVWSTHFISMLAYDPGVEHGYKLIATAASFGIAVIGATISLSIYAYGVRATDDAAAGAVFGVTVAVMHFLGMSAYQFPGVMIWHLDVVVISAAMGAVLSALAFRVIARKFTRWPYAIATLLLVLGICVLHFTGMTAFTMELSPLVVVPVQSVPDGILAAIVFSMTALVLTIGCAALLIELHVEREAKETYDYSRSHDRLTGIPNRLFLEQMTGELERTLEGNMPPHVAILSINLKNFQSINDLKGRRFGDALLKDVAWRLVDSCRDDEFVARRGSDEFVAVKSAIADENDAREFAALLQKALEPPFLIDDETIQQGVVIGIATSLSEGTDLRDVMQKSDLAMHRAKVNPDKDICIYSAALDQKNKDRLQMISDLRKAVENDELELAFQLQNDLISLEPNGFEVLLRWRHPVRGVVPPSDFIPIAEETGLIREIGLWVLRSACIEAARWTVPFSVAVNVAPQQLVHSEFLEQLSDILLETGLPPARLELEITEASIIEDQARALKVMHQIKEMGVRIAMDDFGTGYSSLATLQAFPFDKIKIDRSFVQDVHSNHQRAAIVRSTLLLGQALQIPVLAEGVEIEDELAFLRAEKCNYVQGFYFGKPLNLNDIQEFVTGGPIKAVS